MQFRTLDDFSRLLGNPAEERIDDDPPGDFAPMTTTKQNFSNVRPPAADDRDPDSQLVRLSDAWRLKRGLDDTAENIVLSIQQVMYEHPQLGEQYKYRRETLSRHGNFDHIELVR